MNFGSFFGVFGTLFNDIICYPLGLVLRFSYLFSGNYAVSLIIFTVVVRIFLFPLAIKQQRSSAEMLRMKPKMDQLQKKYAKDQQKLQAEMSKLYQEEGYNPLSGCLPLLIQMPILYGLFAVVYKPLTYIFWYDQPTIEKIHTALQSVLTNMHVSNKSAQLQLYIAKAMKGNMDKLPFLGHVHPIDFNLFGIDLSQNPKWGFHLLVLIPILCYITSALSAWLSMRLNKAVQQGQPGAGMNNMLMVFLMPLMSVWFAFQLPAAVGFYWIISNLFMLVQVILLQRFFSIEKLAAQSEARQEQRRQDIASGKLKVKENAMQRFTRKAMAMQQEQQGAVPGKSGSGTAKLPANASSASNAGRPAQEPMKTNSKGKKSRSQLREEQRRRLAQSRMNEPKNGDGGEDGRS